MKKRWMACAAAVLCALAAALAEGQWMHVTTAAETVGAHTWANVPQGLWIWIDIHSKSLTVYEGTQVKKQYVVATGAAQTPSPIGVYRVNSRFAGELGGFGTRFLGLNVPWGQYGIHGTNKPSSIGSNASHGCIRMHVADSEELYGLIANGTKVVLEGGPYGLLDQGLKNLAPGDRGSHVAALQARLMQLGYAYQWPDGVYGQATQAAVKKAREDLGLPPAAGADSAFYRAIGLILFE